ncbi:MAG: energy transducer TonB [Acidobacteriota bacterium]|nr:energy transducer TonB [Acidobacteriota bacterium]
MQSAAQGGAPVTPPPATPPPLRGEVASGWLTDRPYQNDQREKRFGGAVGTSIVLHLAGALLLVVFMTVVPDATNILKDDRADIVYVFTPGPGGGGGGGGNRSPDPPKKVELEKPKPVVSAPVPVPKPVVDQQVQIPLPPITTQAPVSTPGAMTSLSTPSLGSGTGGGGGTGRGTGTGEGTGSGEGPGSGGGTGGGVYRPGSLVTNPEVLYEKKPTYTAEAMRAKIQGEVEIEGVVMPDGTLANPRIVRSLDKSFGLDQKALEAVKLWRFKPGVLRATGEKVPILVTIALTFTLR